MIATFIFCCLFICSNIKNGQSNNSIVNKMNHLFKQKFWKEYLKLPAINIENKYHHSVKPGERNIKIGNRKIRAVYLIIQYYYSYIIREIVFMFKRQLQNKVSHFEYKNNLNNLDTTFSKIKSSLGLLFIYYNGNDLPTIVQILIDTFENKINNAYNNSLKSKNNDEIIEIRKELLNNVTNILVQLDNFLKDVYDIFPEPFFWRYKDSEKIGMDSEYYALTGPISFNNTSKDHKSYLVEDITLKN
ncbi:uncharacterized protein LOC126906094 isoform X2 [Daktulosphaira vitifoliae]|uniref:uncharacterized protein LOC126906094 isoform X2 n=1 Tax=Daktulosphaira vitifoliae TaxID=58002 RepID=UPI0021A9FFCF|nr:uncharacterized protein LOC126906094 isoform X2 [Daktulosphaira vitifoliae]